MSQYWYDNRHLLNRGDICKLEDDSYVTLDRRVPGDGTDWYVDEWDEERCTWEACDRRIHPSEIEKRPLW